ncbi:hypothetical protein MSAN_00606400 [Mycena sanguinolenta]|uniref:Uncharacterized protein n=1 Tax=Mycena sanguinolenta TaxID=230812 RepID=A0A8H6ZE33_9AGAR|nr:hypothetical protein MSAN_00606400 [Mycena sanguinolenta]
MQRNLVLSFVISLFIIAVSAAPIPDPSSMTIPSREIEHAPFVGMSEVARGLPEAEPQIETENARACRLYACI